MVLNVNVYWTGSWSTNTVVLSVFCLYSEPRTFPYGCSPVPMGCILLLVLIKLVFVQFWHISVNRIITPTL